jgi:solute carrier family 25 protein 14/30
MKQDGIAGLYRGVVPTTQRAMILTASQLPSYDHTKTWLLSRGYNEGIATHVISSIVAGFVCATATSPVDLIKSRYMNQPFDAGKGVKYSSMLDCIVKTVRSEGILSLYKGWLPNWMRISPHTIVTFVVYEKLRSMFNVRPI